MTNKKPVKPAPKKTIPSYMKETFGLVQKGKSNHVSPKNNKRGR
jgi:hypothetical protein